MSPKDKSFVIRALVVTLVISALSMVGVLLVGLFDPLVDNEKIFTILTPISQEVTGALISILSGLVAVKLTKEEEK